MKLLLLGYGKMGRTIEHIATERGHTVVAKIDQPDDTAWEPLSASTVDAAIEFSQPNAAVANIRRCLERGIPVISGTTGWLDQKPSLDDYCQQQSGTFFYASNFSVGVNLFFRLNEWLAELMNKHTAYQAVMEEIHHTEKKDAPSGTALTLANALLARLDQQQSWVLQEDDQAPVHRGPDQLPIHSVREGQVPGTHVVRYESATDDIEIKHTAHSRQGFALGAVLVAEWIPTQQGVLSMRDFLPL